MTICALTDVGGIFTAKSKARDAVGEGERVGDQRLDVELAAAHQRNRARVDMGIAEDVLDVRFLDHGRSDVVGDGLQRNAHEDDRAARAERFEDACGRLLVAAALEDDVDAPAVGELVDNFLEILLGNVDGRNRPERGGQVQLGLLRRRS